MLTSASTVAGVLRPARARAFLITVASRDDYPRHLGYLLQGATDEQVVTLAREVLKVRRATEYAPLVITECSAASSAVLGHATPAAPSSTRTANC